MLKKAFKELRHQCLKYSQQIDEDFEQQAEKVMDLSRETVSESVMLKVLMSDDRPTPRK